MSVATFTAPSYVVTDDEGNVVEGMQFTIWTAKTGGTQVTSLQDLDGDALPGYVTTDAKGRVWFADPAARDVLYVQPPGTPVPARWLVVSDQAQINVGQAIDRSNEAFTIATAAKTTADAAATTATGADGRSVEALTEAQTARRIASSATILSVDAFGAVGDGSADDTAAVQAAIDALPAEGGTISFAAGQTYFFSGRVALRSNLVVQGAGATLIKKNPLEHYEVFVAASNGATGYGSSVRHVTIRDLTIRGDFASGTGASITMNHAQDVTVERVAFYECVQSGHALDLGGCDGVTVRGCRFFGFKPVTTREYAEAIQLDHCIRQGNGVDKDNPSSYDGLPTINVTVENSQFLPLTIGATTYPAPNPLGVHNRVEGMWIEHVRFRDNLVVDGYHTDGWTDTFANISRGWLHFFATRDVQITGNIFKVTDGRAAMVVRSQTLDDAIPLSDTQLVNPSTVTIDPLMPTAGVRIEDNRFEGFRGATVEPLIHLIGRTDVNTGPVRDVQIAGNSLRDCAGATANTDGQHFVVLNMVRDVQIERNTADALTALVEALDTVNLAVRGNQVQSATWWLGKFTSVTGVNVADNAMAGGESSGLSALLYFYQSEDIAASRNRLSTSQALAGVIRMSSCTSLIVSENQITGGSSGIYVYSSSTRGRILNNFVLGATGTPVNLGANTDVTETGNVTS